MPLRCLHSRHIPAMLLKLDLAKAFDSVSWEFLIQLLSHIGFPEWWMEWIWLSSCPRHPPGKRIIHARGLRQGDPLSPMLFVLVMEVLNAMINKADALGLFRELPSSLIRHRVSSLYADDLVLFLAPLQSDLQCIRAILDLFADASGGLLANTDKCSFSSIYPMLRRRRGHGLEHVSRSASAAAQPILGDTSKPAPANQGRRAATNRCDRC